MAETNYIHWVRIACIEARQRAQKTMADIAEVAEKDQSSIFRFEQGNGGGYPASLDSYVAAYARVAGITPMALMAEALKRWGEDHSVDVTAEFSDDRDDSGTMHRIAGQLSRLEHLMYSNHVPLAAHPVLDVIFNHVPIGLGLLDIDKRFTRVNDKLAAFNSRSVTEHLGHTMAEILPEARSVIESIDHVYETGSGLLNEATDATPDEEVRHFVASYVPLRDRRASATTVIGMVIIVREITQQKRIMEMIAQTEITP